MIFILEHREMDGNRSTPMERVEAHLPISDGDDFSLAPILQG
jgi:hypothetical protein